MTWVYTERVECPVCSGKTAHTDVNIHTHERDFNCERCGFFSETKLVERTGRKFWEHTMEMPMSEDGVVAWPELEPVPPGIWSRKAFGVMPGFEDVPEGFGAEEAK